MSYVSIWKPVNDRIVESALESKNEIIGLLLGRLENDAIIIEDSITGEYSAEANRATLPGQTLAKIADDLVNGRVKGHVIGWYHSHIDSGLFFSATDSKTQKELQQFSSLVVGMVVDAAAGSVGYYRVDPQTSKPVRIPAERLRIYEERSEAIPREARRPVRPTPVIETRRARIELKLPTRTLILAVIMVVLVASGILIAALLCRGTRAAPALSVSATTPVLTDTIGTPIEVRANVSGSAQIVKLLYAAANSGALVAVNMSSPAPGEFAYTIPGNQVTGNILYYLEAIDSSGNRVRSNAYQIQIADFRLTTTNTTLAVYRTGSVASELNLLPMNGFNGSVMLTSSGQPSGLRVAFSQNPIPPGITTIYMDVIANSQAANGTFPITITATYSPPNATPITRQMMMEVTVADFSIQVTPTSRQLGKGGMTTYELTLTILHGFTDRVNVSVQGLPAGAVAKFTTAGSTLAVGPGVTIVTLQIDTTISIKPGTYPLTIIASGGGVVHYQILQLTVR